MDVEEEYDSDGRVKLMRYVDPCPDSIDKIIDNLVISQTPAIQPVVLQYTTPTKTFTPEKRIVNPLREQQRSDEHQPCPDTIRRVETSAKKVIGKKARERMLRKLQDHDQHRIAIKAATDEHFRIQATPCSYGERAINEQITNCNSLRSCEAFLPKGFQAEGRFVSRDANLKQIRVLNASQKRRKLAKEAKFNIVEKTLVEITKDGIAEAEESELLFWCLKKEKEAEEKEFKAAQAIVNRRTAGGKYETDDTDDNDDETDDDGSAGE